MSLPAVETDLLAAIAAEPDAIEPRLIYGDWLQARNDPRGELIAVQAGLLARPDDVQLLERQRELTKELTDGLILQTGAEPLSTELIVRWHLGFVDALQLNVRTIHKLRTTHREWFRQPAFAAVREVQIHSKYARTLRAIRHLGLSNSVRRLEFGERGERLEEPTISAIAARLPKLTALRLHALEVPPLTALSPLGLRELSLEVGTLTDPGLARIMVVAWKLDKFGLQTSVSIADDMYPLLAQLYDGTTLPTVKHFVVGPGVRVINVIDTLATSKRVATVETLTGDFNRMTYEEQVRAERHRSALAHVKLEPLLGPSDYYIFQGLTAVATFLNYRLDRAAEALPYYERALRIKPEDSTARHNLGVALRKLGRLDESLVAFDTIIDLAKKPSASMFNGRHYTLCELGRRTDARADLERALQIEPNFADAWNNLGVERQYSGDSEGALAAFRRCSQINPDHGYSVRNEAELLLELGLAGEALPIFTRLLAAEPRDRTLMALITHAQVEMNNAAEARATLDARLADPEQERNLRLFVLRALALRDLGEHAAARTDLDACATSTDCPGWYGMALYVRTLDDRALWSRIVPDSAIAPREIADAVIAYGKTSRPSNAKAMHDPTADDQMACAELAVAAALLANQRDLAVQRARAVATLYAEQGPRFLRRWWQTLATVIVVTNRHLDDNARELLSLVIRAVRGRRRIADVMMLDN